MHRTPLGSPSLKEICRCTGFRGFKKNSGRKQNIYTERKGRSTMFSEITWPVVYAQFFLDTRKWHPKAIENHLWSGRGLLAKLWLQVSLSNNDTEPSTARRKLFKRSFYIFSVDISLKISQREPPLEIRHEDRIWDCWKTSCRPTRTCEIAANKLRGVSISCPSSKLTTGFWPGKEINRITDISGRRK